MQNRAPHDEKGLKVLSLSYNKDRKNQDEIQKYEIFIRKVNKDCEIVLFWHDNREKKTGISLSYPATVASKNAGNGYAIIEIERNNMHGELKFGIQNSQKNVFHEHEPCQNSACYPPPLLSSSKTVKVPTEQDFFDSQSTLLIFGKTVIVSPFIKDAFDCGWTDNLDYCYYKRPKLDILNCEADSSCIIPEN